MLKTRIIPTLLYKDHGLVKGVRFDKGRRVGTVLPAIKVYKSREVDELILLDVSATPEKRTVDHVWVSDIADECSMPLTIGGGINAMEDIYRLLQAGADKVSINTGALENPELIDEASANFGSQCIVLSIDVKKHYDGSYEVYSGCGTLTTGKNPIAWAQEAALRGAGEILLTSIDNDGTMEGYDIGLTQQVAKSVSIPVIASGGAGKYQHMYEVIQYGKADAIAAASIFHFTEQTPLKAKEYLSGKGLHMRI